MILLIIRHIHKPVYMDSPKTPTQVKVQSYPSWTTQIVCNKVFPDKLAFGQLPIHSTLFRGQRNSQLFTDPKNIAWFGDYNLCGSLIYGSDIWCFITPEPLNLINIGDISTHNIIYNTLCEYDKVNRTNHSKVFKRVFRLVRSIDREPYIQRSSEKPQDLQIALILKELLGHQCNGWFHFELQYWESSRKIAPEVMLFDYNKAGMPMNVPLTPEQRRLAACKPKILVFPPEMDL